MASSRFVVLKFGGTTVPSLDRWRSILAQARARITEGLRPLIVYSDLSKVTDLLGQLATEAATGTGAATLERIRARHSTLALQLGVEFDSVLGPELLELERCLLGASLLGETSPWVRAHILAMGELFSTRLGAAFMNREGLETEWIDARACFTTVDDERRSETERALSGALPHRIDDGLQRRLEALAAPCLVTQGFIAADHLGRTVLLGHGGSDTSAACFAAALQARRCEIWTDVPGIFTADPRLIPSSFLVMEATYDEAQEIASLGSEVLHPRCIAPCRAHKIPMEIRWTEQPDRIGTRIVDREAMTRGPVKSLSHKRGVLLVSMETQGMWQQADFLSDILACFKNLGLSVDRVSSSQMNVTVSLDASGNTLDDATLARLLADLGTFCHARIIRGCAAISLVGRPVRALLPQPDSAFSVFEDQPIYLVSQTASDLNLTFVVDESQVERLVRELHDRLFTPYALPNGIFGPSWRELMETEDHAEPTNRPSWWKTRRGELLALADTLSPVFVLDPTLLREAADSIRRLPIDQAFYAMKANPHPDVLALFEERGLGFECVSKGELDHLLHLFPRIARERVLFTPNFAPRREYEHALGEKVRVTIDNLFVLEHWGDLLKGCDILLRIDPGSGRGHHAHVRTGGKAAKFGIAFDHLDRAGALATKAGATVIGLHAHVGSGILDAETWSEVASKLVQASEYFPETRILDLGGGLGVPESATQPLLDLDLLSQSLQKVRAAYPRFKLWIEPGRYLVARAGALLTRVTQVKRKADHCFVGVDTGMNSLIRPALYGAYHEIVNLTRLGEPPAMVADIVGPICESGDILGRARSLPECREGDVMLIGTTGAYGRAMSSGYNLRPLTPEVLLSGNSCVPQKTYLP